MKNFRPYKFQDRFNNLDSEIKEYKEEIKKRTYSRKQVKSITISAEFYKLFDEAVKNIDDKKVKTKDKKNIKLVPVIIPTTTTTTQFITIKEGPHIIYL
jgi:hypothetical protein